MNKNFSLKFKLFDIFIMAFAVVFIVGTIIGTNIYSSSQGKDNQVVQIYYQNNLIENKQVRMSDVNGVKTITLTKEEFPNLLGDMEIEIDANKGVRIKEVTCPNHTCSKQGYVKQVGYPIVCIPNGVYVIISDNKVDNDIILG